MHMRITRIDLQRIHYAGKLFDKDGKVVAELRGSGITIIVTDFTGYKVRHTYTHAHVARTPPTVHSCEVPRPTALRRSIGLSTPTKTWCK